MTYTMADIRAALVSRWKPPLDLSGELGSEAMEEVWEEFLRVQAVGAWRSSSALCGQILEANVKSAITAKTGEAPKKTRALTFEEAINRAIELELLGAPARRTILLGLHSARRRRNLVSHFSPFERQRPTEERALYLLASLICYSDWLALPDGRPHQVNIGALDKGAAARHQIAKTCKDGLLPAGATWEGLFADAIEIGSAKSVCNTVNRVQKSPHAPSRQLVEVLHVQFHLIIRGAARSDIGDVLDLIRGLRRLGMAPHAQVLASLLPIDVLLLQILDEYSPASALKRATEFLYASRTADPHQYSAIFSNAAFQGEVLASIVALVMTGDYDARDFSPFFKQLPMDVRAVLFGSRSLANALVTTLPAKPAVAGVDALCMLPWNAAGRRSATRVTYRHLCDQLVARCHAVDASQLGWVLARVGESFPTDGPLFDAIVEVFIARASKEPSAHDGLEATAWFVARNICGVDPVINRMTDALLSKGKGVMRVAAWATRDVKFGLERLPWHEADDALIHAAVNDVDVDAYRILRLAYALQAHGRLSHADTSAVRGLLALCKPNDALTARLLSSLAEACA